MCCSGSAGHPDQPQSPTSGQMQFEPSIHTLAGMWARLSALHHFASLPSVGRCAHALAIDADLGCFGRFHRLI
jgi:hypothetical protein